ncbi:hypothetical protein ACOMHN_001090 [Nucella lapillus]
MNRCGPPPEFPLASSYSGIVHHLSGPNVHAPAPPHRRRGRDGPVVRPPPRRGQDPTWARQRRPSLSLRLRVSRVGWRADRFATDPVPAGPTHRTVQGSGRQTRLPSLCQSNIPGGRGGPSRRRLLGPRGRIGTGEAIPARAKARTYHPRRLLTAREPVVALCPRKVHTADARPETGRVLRSPTRRPVAAAFRAEFRGPTLRIHPFTSRRFHVLLNSLFKVLFNFPSRYLSAIGLVPVFSLRWSLPPA